MWIVYGEKKELHWASEPKKTNWITNEIFRKNHFILLFFHSRLHVNCVFYVCLCVSGWMLLLLFQLLMLMLLCVFFFFPHAWYILPSENNIVFRCAAATTAAYYYCCNNCADVMSTLSQILCLTLFFVFVATKFLNFFLLLM